MDKKKLPIGISDYKLVIEEDFYYVDKTDFIRQIIEEGSLITLLPRPRRFGKTLNLSTLRYFFERTEGNVYLLAEGPSQIREGVEALIQGYSICSVINDKLSFPDLLADQSNIWSFMLFSGYLKASDPALTPEDLTEYTLQVPNREVKTVFRTIVQSWINNGPVKNNRLQQMLQALDENNMPTFQRLLNDFVVNTLSYYDTSGRDPEKVYQAFLLGMLVSSGAYEVSSNRESGLGRYDILMRPRDIRKRGVIMELKLYAPIFDTASVDEVLDSALRQIEEKQYAATLHAVGVKDILKMAITFDGKRVWVKTVEE